MAGESDRRELELYFHIPFCVKKCLYCDFLSAPADEETKKRYMEALLDETAGGAPLYRGYTVVSVFIGGGTPSAVSPHWMERLMETVRGHYRLAEDAEVTIEVNPGTVDAQGLAQYYGAGINRLSIGLQSSRDEELAVLGRIHTWEQFRTVYREAGEAGFHNINVDLMSALPGQEPAQYRETLRRVVSLEPPPPHISAYSLILEEGTEFFRLYEAGRLKLPDEDTDRLMYQETKEFLSRRGYRRYEISNYAREGYECRHNCGYWQRRDYAGFGIGAASLVENVRFRNCADLERYLKNPLGCREDLQTLGRGEQMEEFMFLGLRMTQGVSLGEFRRLFGCGVENVYRDVVCKNLRDGLLEMREESEGAKCQAGAAESEELPGAEVPWAGRLALTERGLDLSNYVMAQFLRPQEDGR